MADVFLSTSFSKQVDYESGLVFPEFKSKLEAVLDSLRNLGGYSVFCAVEHEGWRIGNEPPEVGVAKDIEEIAKAGMILALLPKIDSGGLQWEMGHADSRKPVYAAVETGENLGYFNQGLVNLGLINLIEYASPDDLTSQLTATRGISVLAK
jgi:hypothetical protein